jgi:hypothetical protein
MNSRERLLALILVVLLVGVGGIFGFMQLFLKPLQDYTLRIATASEEVADKTLQLKRTRDSLVKLQRYRQLSLPADPDRAKREYENYLNTTLIKSGFTPGTFNVTSRGMDTRNSPTLTDKKKPTYAKLTFTAEGTARLDSLVRFLEAFYRTGLLHQIKDLSITRSNTPNVPRPGQPGVSPQQRQNELVISMKVEALILSGADNHNYLLPNIDSHYLAADALAAMGGKPVGIGAVLWALGPTGPRGPGVLAESGRNYQAILHKDIFFGPPLTTPKDTEELDYTQLVKLTDITHTPDFLEACLYQWFDDKTARLRTTLGHNQYRLLDDKHQLVVQVNVVKIEDQDIILQVDDRFYSMHVGWSLAEALQQPLSDKQVEALLKERVNAQLKGAINKGSLRD